MIIFPSGGTWEIIFLKKYMEIWSFLCTRTGVTNLVLRPSVKKNQRWSYPAKIHLKVIDVLDWHSRKSSNNSQYFHGDLYRRFHYCSAARKKKAKKKTGNLIYRIEVWLLLQFIRMKIFEQWIIFNTLQHSTLRSCIWRCAWATIKKIICPLGDGLWFQKYKSSGKNFLVQR